MYVCIYMCVFVCIYCVCMYMVYTVSVRSAGELDGEGVSLGIYFQRLPESNIQIHHHALAGHSELLVVEPSVLCMHVCIM